ncbi:wax ester/triacylglycerol synthase family O-acyltransferase [Gordonia sp. PDNC005]|uniref:wax ester/triacylglycerol synthase family O-acyltransferase n=1 Tax=unclassified Gordonia (in: high G+C Gram-positive bacteria) TaxID=2657482 RepID=UPI00196294F2|nr:wax ester/triacylglycerol synthase family O-acyltransferase [Gordonia sp. PDNC005]QRY61437.1 wax ester/triacylglycerol synthase family O-acyltransferase [Gordonia sp. PDNC005]
MVKRLSAEDAMYYFLDGSGTSAHMGSLLVIDPSAAGDGSRLDYHSLVSLVERRLQLMPRYRQVVKEVTLGLGRPLWVDDPDFDVNFHVRLSALPHPGSMGQLQELIARIMSRPLGRERPLWEMYLIEGLSGGRVAVLTKSHRCLVAGETNREIGEVVCDTGVVPPELAEDLWMPGSPPGQASMTVGALTDAMARPGELVDSLLRGNGPVADIWSVADKSARFVASTVQQVVNTAPDSPLNSVTTSSRLFACAQVSRRDCMKIATRFDCTFNDVVLAVLAGVLRRWTLSTKDTVTHGETIRVIVPLRAREADAAVSGPGHWVPEYEPEFVTDLPIGEDSPAVRLMQVAGLADRYSGSTRRLAPEMKPLLPELGMVPFADFSTRAFSQLFQRTYNVPISMSDSVSQRYLAGHAVEEIYTIPTLAAQRAMAISVNEYGGAVQFGFVADRAVVSDLPAMAGYIAESLDELLTSGLPQDR